MYYVGYICVDMKFAVNVSSFVKKCSLVVNSHVGFSRPPRRSDAIDDFLNNRRVLPLSI